MILNRKITSKQRQQIKNFKKKKGANYLLSTKAVKNGKPTT